jgi:hypothetical protein
MRLTFDAQDAARNQWISHSQNWWTKSPAQIKTRDCNPALDLISNSCIPDHTWDHPN